MTDDQTGKRGRREPEQGKRKVRTTMQPDSEIEVGEAEYTDLKRQGLLIETDETGQPVNTPAEQPEEQQEPPKRERGTGGRA
jgi:hypothetical protein